MKPITVDEEYEVATAALGSGETTLAGNGFKKGPEGRLQPQYTDQGRVSVARGDRRHVPTQRGVFDRCSPQQAREHPADGQCSADANEVKHE
jgi:hypothetical protein